jgi:hypothetical protein
MVSTQLTTISIFTPVTIFNFQVFYKLSFLLPLPGSDVMTGLVSHAFLMIAVR